MADGARDALGGYLYQFLGAAGLSARAKNIGNDPDSGGNRHSLSRKSSLIHEQSDMDIVINYEGGNALGVQFKHSAKTPPRSIEASELIEILDAFHRSLNRCAGLSFTGFALISNRRFAESARKLYATRGKTRHSRTLLPRAVPGKPKKGYKKALDQYGSANQAAAERHSILSRLVTDLGVTQIAWIEEVRSYANRHGVLPPEFDRALTRLVGAILQQTVGKPLELTTDFLNECLLGAADARSLTVAEGKESAHSAANRALSEYTSRTLVPDQKVLIRRRLIDEVEKQAVLHPLVFVVGDGGSGKSVLASEFLRNEAPRRFVAAAGASEVTDGWLGRLFRQWRSPRNSHNFTIEQIDEVVGRLRLANCNASRPILMLDLDGIDEVAFEHRHAVRFVINHFWQAIGEKTDAVLLVTSRAAGANLEHAIDELLGEWISSDIFFGQSDKVGKVFVREFDEDELSEAARQLGEDYWIRIAPALAPGGLGDPRTDILGAGEAPPSSAYRPADPTMVRSLRHPAMWGSFVSLPPDRRHPILDRERGALLQLAECFLRRFCEKTRRRRTTLVTERVLMALSAICAAMPNKLSVFTRQKHWIEPARGPLSDYGADLLFEEAISYGLIVVEAKHQWAWRHAFVCDFLRGH